MSLQPAESTEAHAKRLVKQANGRVTAARVEVLSRLLTATSALSHKDILTEMQQGEQSIDRVTVYRTLDWLVEAGIAHKVASQDKAWHFNVLPAEQSSDHAHFQCQVCQNIYCMHDLLPVTQRHLPDGFTLTHTELNLQGICPSCEPS